MNNREIQWHLPYIAAMNLEMEKDRERFVFVPEYVLNTGAIKIDLFIENTEDSPASNEIGKMFQKYNILEYKNPHDTLGIDEFVKAQMALCIVRETSGTGFKETSYQHKLFG